MSKNLKTQWRVQVRDSRKHAWRNKSGLFETRQVAREEAALLRDLGYGFFNTRVIKYVKGQK